MEIKIVMDMSTSIFITRLNKIRECNSHKDTFINKDLYKLLTKEEVLVAGYDKIKSNRGATTPATTFEPLDRFSLAKISKLQAALKNESWKPRRARRIYIPKPGKVEKRPLGIQGPEEKVVQAVVGMILEAIYEPIFSPKSFGFRPGKGAHDALKMIDQNYDGMTFALEGDIKGMYDSVNHHILIQLLEKRIKDDRFKRLIWKLLRAGYMDGEREVSPTKGTPQGSIVSPNLANIYLHELDKYMGNLCKEKATQRSPNRRTPPFKEIESERRKVIRTLDKNPPQEERKGYIDRLRELKKRSLSVRMYTKGSDRILYTRYADHFIIGIAGSQPLILEIKEEVGKFLETLNLKLNHEKSKITDLRKENTIFLGHRIGINTRIKTSKVHVKGRSPFTRRVTGKFVQITAPLDKIVSRLQEKGFCDAKGRPKHKTMWITQQDNQIIDLFNHTSRGVFGFYSGVDKKHALSRISYIFKFSCAMTMAAKHSCSLAKIFEKHGPTLQVTYGGKGEKQIRLYQPDLRKRSRVWQTGKDLPDPFRHIATRLSRTKIYDKCCICGADSAEMHHVRHLRDSKQASGSIQEKQPISGFTRIMGSINRKQIAVCENCHDSIHAGRYDGMSLKDFASPESARR